MWLATLPLLVNSTVMASENLADAHAAQVAQDQFIGCLAGYIGAKYMGSPAPDYDLTRQLATKIVKEIAPICPNPTVYGSDLDFSEPGLANSWMVAMAAQFLVLFGNGEKPLPKKR
ncbi:hypothetical protein [Rugamonas sp. DEMB1]|uniref:hypothetical protein n=1 Tax=Rugamonas sp. DEMB1 TaxID=3039386 RepID=UPI00244D001C|nr:hypothetical protein [Rugamonas sp. DEMB1]WGG53228.1 hypothetical protein QC826_14625 [Rugamonas sp. DEMB1]